MKSMIYISMYTLFFYIYNCQNSTTNSSNSSISNLTNQTSQNMSIKYLTQEAIQNIQNHDAITQCIMVTKPVIAQDCLKKTNLNYINIISNKTAAIRCCYTNWKYNISSSNSKQDYKQCVPWLSEASNFETYYTQSLIDSNATDVIVTCSSIYLTFTFLTIIFYLSVFV